MRTFLPTQKMSTSLASELLAMIESTPYKQIVPALAAGAGLSETAGAGLSETVFPKTKLATKYILQTNCWLDGFHEPERPLRVVWGVQ